MAALVSPLLGRLVIPAPALCCLSRFCFFPGNALEDHLLSQALPAYAKTRNPLFVWLAFSYCATWRKAGIPKWCLEYMELVPAASGRYGWMA